MPRSNPEFGVGPIDPEKLAKAEAKLLVLPSLEVDANTWKHLDIFPAYLAIELRF